MSWMDWPAGLMRMLPPETAHRLTVQALAAAPASGARPEDPRLRTTLPRSGLVLPNPIGLAAGFDKNAEAFCAMFGLGFGFVECGTVTPRPQIGNPRPRLFRLPEDRAVINRMGFNNEGLAAFVARLQRGAGAGVLGANVGANKDSEDRVGDYAAGVAAVWPHCSYIAINVSSPNTPGLRGLQDRTALEELLGRTGETAQAQAAQFGPRPIFLKVAPDLDDAAISDIAEVARAAPVLHGLIISNTTLSRPDTLKGLRRGETGGLSGAPLADLSTRVLARFAKELGGSLDLIGVGGVGSADDVLAKLRAGAHAVQLYSALVYEGPQLAQKIKRDLVARMDAVGACALADLLPPS